MCREVRRPAPWAHRTCSRLAGRVTFSRCLTYTEDDLGRGNLDDHDLHPGRILGSYELLVPVGSGGTAHVWAARHLGSGVVFALKMLLPHLAENNAFRDMFFDEARIASRIRHENVARTFELTELDGILTLVMEWVDGSSLDTMLRPGSVEHDDVPRVALPIRHAVKMVAETCAGLHAAHELAGDDGKSLEVVHRDVSPHNVLLTLDGHVKVTDFGVAKALGKSQMTIAGQIKGKLAYMSPEQLVGGGVDRRSDVFALGSVLYEATTGQRPFQGDHDPQIMAAIIMGNCPRPSVVVRGYPRELDAIIARAMSTDPSARYATALQLKQALDGWLAISGPPIRAAQISLLLQERCGAELANRLEILSVSKIATGPSSTGPHLRVDTGSAMEVQKRRPSARAGRTRNVTTTGAVIAILVGLFLGLAVLSWVQTARNEHRAARLELARTEAANARANAEPSIDDAAVRTVLGVDDDEPKQASKRPSSNDVKLKIPDGAWLVVEGRELPFGASTVPRPRTGATSVLVRADAYADRWIELQPDSPPEIDVAMTEKRRTRPRTTAPRANPASTVVMPPNPYE